MIVSLVSYKFMAICTINCTIISSLSSNMAMIKSVTFIKVRGFRRDDSKILSLSFLHLVLSFFLRMFYTCRSYEACLTRSLG